MDDDEDNNLGGYPYTVFEPPPLIEYTQKKLNQINPSKKKRTGHETEDTDGDTSDNEDYKGNNNANKNDNNDDDDAASTLPAASQVSSTAMSDDGFRPFPQQGSQYPGVSGFPSPPVSSLPEASTVNSDVKVTRLGKRSFHERGVLERNNINPAAVLPPPPPTSLQDRHLLHVNTIMRLSLLKSDWRRAKRAFKLLLGARTETKDDEGAVDLRALWNVGVEILAQECEADAKEKWKEREREKNLMREAKGEHDDGDEDRNRERTQPRKGKGKQRQGRRHSTRTDNARNSEDESEDEDEDDGIETVPGYGGTAKVDGVPVDYSKVTDFLERLIVLYPYYSRKRKKGTQRPNATTFLPTLLHYRILTLTAMLNTVGAEELTTAIEALANDDDDDEDEDNLSLDRLSLNSDDDEDTTRSRRKQVNRDVKIVETVLNGIDEMLERITELQITPPWIDMVELWELRGMINLWGCDIVKDYLMSYPSPSDNMGSKHKAEVYSKGARKAGAVVKEKGGKGWEEMLLSIVDEDEEMEDGDEDNGDIDDGGEGGDNESEGEEADDDDDDDDDDVNDEDYSNRESDSNHSGADGSDTGMGNSRYIDGRQTITLRNQHFMDSDSDG